MRYVIYGAGGDRRNDRCAPPPGRLRGVPDRPRRPLPRDPARRPALSSRRLKTFSSISRAPTTPGTPTSAPADAVILCMKGQHTEEALRDLYSATGGQAHVICCQNGVENERLALRRFPHTYGMVVWLPAEHLEPGVVVNFAENTAGGLDAGCYPTGIDDFITEVTTALTKAGFSAEPDADIMRHKYEKLLANLSNAVNAATGEGSRRDRAHTPRRGARLLCRRRNPLRNPSKRPVPVAARSTARRCPATTATAGRPCRA